MCTHTQCMCMCTHILYLKYNWNAVNWNLAYMIHLPRALKQDDFQQFGSMAFCIFSNFCWHYLKNTSQAHCQGISKVHKVIGHTTKNITCIYYQDYMKYINFITRFLSLYMLMLISCYHFFNQSTTCYLLVYTCCIWLVCVQGWIGKLACPQWCSYEELASCLNTEAICKYHMALSQVINILHENDTYMLK